MRLLLASTLIAAFLVHAGQVCAQHGKEHPKKPPAATAAPPAKDLARAKELDKEGAKAYSEGRYNDAVRYFEEAHRLGGPPFELWNIAKCYLRLDQPEQAAAQLERYVATPNLPAQDAKEARQQLEELKTRTSTMTVSSEPNGAKVTIDGRTPSEGGGKTPLSLNVAPGNHVVVVTFEKDVQYTRTVEARYGRAIIVDATRPRDAPPPANPYASAGGSTAGKEEPAAPDRPVDRKIAVRGAFGLVLPKHGEVGGTPAVGFLLAGSYRLTDVFAVGGMFTINGDSWESTTLSATNSPPNCNGRLVSDPNNGTALSFLLTGSAGFPLLRRVRAQGVAGLGLAAYAVGDVSGEVFLASCKTSPGVRPTFMFGGEVSWAVTDAFHLSVFPIVLQLHPAFSGTRDTPGLDATGLWLRAMFALGAGIDF